MSTPILADCRRAGALVDELMLVYTDGVEITVTLGANVLSFDGEKADTYEARRRALEDDAVALMTELVERDQISVERLLGEGVPYTRRAEIDGSVVLEIRVRLATIEQAARAIAHRLRSPHGLRLSRQRANDIAETIESLLSHVSPRLKPPREPWESSPWEPGHD